MKISRQEVEQTARLARLDLDQEEAERMTAQLDTILSYVAKLDELDTSGLPTGARDREAVNAFREDIIRESLLRERALANAPQHNDEAFVVPKVIG